MLRGIPDLLVMYPLYFGGGAAMTAIGRALGAEGLAGVNAFESGAIAGRLISGVYQGAIFRSDRTRARDTPARAALRRADIFLNQGVIEEDGKPAELFANRRSDRLRQFLSSHLGL